MTVARPNQRPRRALGARSGGPSVSGFLFSWAELGRVFLAMQQPHRALGAQSGHCRSVWEGQPAPFGGAPQGTRRPQRLFSLVAWAEGQFAQTPQLSWAYWPRIQHWWRGQALVRLRPWTSSPSFSSSGLGPWVLRWQQWWSGWEKPSGSPHDALHEVLWARAFWVYSLLGPLARLCGYKEGVSFAARGRVWTTHGDPCRSSDI